MIRILLFLLAPMFVAPAAWSAPFTPTADAQVLETLPARATDPAMREIRDLRARLAKNPRDLDAALALARSYYAQVAAEGDPRYIGYAQAALAPWWDAADPPVAARVMRAVLRQFSHQFDAARNDLLAAVREEPGNGQAWAWLAAIDMVQTRYADAREACLKMAGQAGMLVEAACVAYVDSMTGHADAASRKLHALLALARDATPAERLWSLTMAAEIDERRGDAAAAEAAFREALALGITDGYLLSAYSDFLLDHGRPAEVLALLKGRERSDLLLLRLALAAKATGAPEAARWRDDLAARFDAARLRGDTVHQKEESRFALALEGDAARALALAEADWRVQREPSDARALLEAAIAARRPDAAAPVLQWLDEHQVESAVLRRLAAQLKGAS